MQIRKHAGKTFVRVSPNGAGRASRRLQGATGPGVGFNRLANIVLVVMLVVGLCVPALPPGENRAYASDWKFKSCTGTLTVDDDSDFAKYWGVDEPNEGSDTSSYQRKSLDGKPIWCAKDSMSTNMPRGKYSSVDPVAKGIWDQSVATDLALAWYYIYKTDLYRTPAGKKLATDKERYAAMGVMQWGILRDADIADGKSGRYTDYYGSRKMSVYGVDVTGWNNSKWTPNGPWKAMKAWIAENRSKYVGHAHYFDFDDSSSQNVAGLYEVEVLHGAIRLVKSSADASMTNGNPYYSLEGAVYGVFESEAKAASHDAGQAIKTYSTDSNGSFETGMDYEADTVYYVSEIQPSSGFKLDEGVYPVKVAANVKTQLDVSEQPKLGGIRLGKSSANPRITDGNGCYALKGATYGVFGSEGDARTHDASKALKTYGTDAGGAWQSGMVFSPGAYYVAETASSEGFLIDDAVYPVNVETDVHVAVNGTTGSKEPERYASLDLLIAKLDADAGDVEQGDARRADAEFRVCYYDGYYDASGLPGSATRSWIVKTDGEGRVYWAHPNKVSGDDFYRNSAGDIVMPLGTVTVQETKAPQGYNLETPDGNAGLYVMQVRADDSAQTGASARPLNYSPSDSAGNGYAVAVGDVVKRGDFRIVKEGSTEIREDAPQEANRILVPGVAFQILNDSDHAVLSPEDGTTLVQPGGVVCTVTTDENGLADTRGAAANGWKLPDGWTAALAYGSYVVHEVIPDEVQASFKETYKTKLIAAPDWKITISEEGQRDPSVLVRNNIPQSALKIVKIDAETGEPIARPVSYQILDAHGNVLSYTSHYPEESTIDTFTANSRGELTLPMLLAGGTYSLREVEAPEGYVLSETPVEFTIDDYGSWDNPLTVTMENVPVKGKVRLQKADAETGEAVAGAVYVVAAADDIVTPDGTVRMEEGATAAILSLDEEGTACTDELYLGNYKVYEAKSPNGYALDTAEHAVSLSYEDQTVPVVEVGLPLQDRPSTFKVMKVDTKTGASLAGARFRVWQDGVDGAAFETEIVTGDDGTAKLERLARGTYHAVEIQAPVGYHLPETPSQIDFKVDDQGLVGVEGQGFSDVLGITVENAPNEIGTQASIDASKSIRPEGRVKLTDKVTYRGCTPGKEYRVSGVLHRAVEDDQGNRTDAGELLDANGNAITAEATFTAENQEGSIDVVFEFDAASVPGTHVVAFEEMRQGEDLFAVHADINDEDQTVFVEPEIKTTLVDEATGNHSSRSCGKVLLVDTVTYRGLEPGREYKVAGALMYKSSVEPVMRDDGSCVESEATFRPEASEGAVDVVFKLDGTQIAGRDVVAFEQLYSEDVLVAEHADESDAAQTVSFPSAKTNARDKHDGDSTVEPDGKATVVDTVTYKGLVPGVKYVVEGELHATEGKEGSKKDVGVLRDAKDKAVKAKATFTPKRASGKVEVAFTFDASKLDGKQAVAFEKVKQVADHGKAITVAVHEDVNDAAQAVAFSKGSNEAAAKKRASASARGSGTPKAGDVLIGIAAGLMLLAAISGIVAFAATRQRSRRSVRDK